MELGKPGGGKSTSKKPASRKKQAKRETTRRKPSAKEKLGFHTPFEEFSIPKLEDLLALVDKMRPPESVVEVSPVQDTPHVVCMMPLTHILVHSAEGSEHQAEIVYAMYQYCSHCKLAVRVL
ncbi:MAG TPA: hypothetical protein VFE98_08370 [Candidatus Bathyarchaeia archaeon]|nr:hypothetical protein [Candidatus Bathyarchaeia archaeon]